MDSFDVASAVVFGVEGLVALTTRDMLESESKCSGQHMDLLCYIIALNNAFMFIFMPI